MFSVRGWLPFACTVHTSFSSCSSFCPANTYTWSVKKRRGGRGGREEEEEGGREKEEGERRREK